MATIKQRLHRKNSSNTYDTIHLETSADLITGTLPIAHGGTGATTAANARTNIGAAATSHTHAISQVTNLQTTLNGKANSSHNHSASNITSGTLSVARGGTGRSTLTSGYFLRGNGTGAVTMSSIDQVKTALGIGGVGGTYFPNMTWTLRADAEITLTDDDLTSDKWTYHSGNLGNPGYFMDIQTICSIGMPHFLFVRLKATNPFIFDSTTTIYPQIAAHPDYSGPSYSTFRFYTGNSDHVALRNRLWKIYVQRSTNILIPYDMDFNAYSGNISRTDTNNWVSNNIRVVLMLHGTNYGAVVIKNGSTTISWRVYTGAFNNP